MILKRKKFLSIKFYPKNTFNGFTKIKNLKIPLAF